MNSSISLWNIGFALLATGIGIPIVYGLYKFVLASIPWYWRISIILIILGVLTLLVSAARDTMKSSKPKERV